MTESRSNQTTKSKTGLGRGLRSLIPESRAPEESIEEEIVSEVTTSALSYVNIENLEAGTSQPRQHFEEHALRDLSASISEHGILQPLVIRRKAGHKFEIIAGERRWRAAKSAGLSVVPCIISEISTNEALKVALVENLQREDLNAIEEAQGYHRLSVELGLTHEQIAQSVGKDRSTVANAMRLLKLPASVRDLVVNRRVSMGHARALLAIRDDFQIEKVANKIANEGLSVRATERFVQKIASNEEVDRSAAKKKRLGVEPAEERSVRRRLESCLGTRVEIHNKKGSGTIVLHFSDINQLNDLLDKLSFSAN